MERDARDDDPPVPPAPSDEGPDADPTDRADATLHDLDVANDWHRS